MRADRYPLFVLLLLISLTSVTGCAEPAKWRGLIKIGLVAPFSGYDAETATAILAAMRSDVGEWNRSDRNGLPRIELVSLDDENDERIAASRVRELAVDKDVVAAVARLGGRSEAPLLEYERRSLPVALLGGPFDLSSGSEGAWQLCANASQEGQAVAEFAEREVYPKRPAYVVAKGEGFRRSSLAFDHAMGNKARRFEATAAADGSTVISGEDTVALANAVADFQADFVYFSGPYDAGARFAKAMAGLSRAAVVLGGDSDNTAVSGLVPQRGTGVATVSLCRLVTRQSTDADGARAAARLEATRALASAATRLVLKSVELAGQQRAMGRFAMATAMSLEALSGEGSADMSALRFDPTGRQMDVAPVVRWQGGWR